MANFEADKLLVLANKSYYTTKRKFTAEKF